MTKSIFAIAAVLLAASSSLAGQPASRTVPADLAERVRGVYGLTAEQTEDLKTKGEITRFQGRDWDGLLLPDRLLSAELVREMRLLEPSVLVETLFVVPLDPASPRGEGFDLAVYNLLRSISTMKGMEYYSASRGRMRIMFHDAYVVGEPESRKAIPDPVERMIPRESLLHAYQHDSSFGRNTYEIRYTRRDTVYRVSMKNLTVMYYGVLPVVQPEKLRIELVIIPGNDHLLFYGGVGVSTYSLFGFEKKVNDSFYNRIKALYGWFSGEFDKNIRGKTF
jgi:hypothetical protein